MHKFFVVVVVGFVCFFPQRRNGTKLRRKVRIRPGMGSKNSSKKKKSLPKKKASRKELIVKEQLIQEEEEREEKKAKVYNYVCVGGGAGGGRGDFFSRSDGTADDRHYVSVYIFSRLLLKPT